jgi:hypothetical protein
LDKETLITSTTGRPLTIIGYRIADKFDNTLGVDRHYPSGWPEFCKVLANVQHSLVLCHTAGSLALKALEKFDFLKKDFARFALLCFSSDGCTQSAESPYVHFVSYRVPVGDSDAAKRLSALVKAWRSFSVMPTPDQMLELWAIVDPQSDQDRIVRLKALEPVLIDGEAKYGTNQAIVAQHLGRPLSYAELQQYYLDECKKVDIKKN